MKPHAAVSKSTISRSVGLVLQKAGIDPTFGPHSTRAAATLKAKFGGILLETIMRAAGWSSTSVFAKFYEKLVETHVKTVQDAVLEGQA